MKLKRSNFGAWLRGQLQDIRSALKNPMLTGQERMSYQGSEMTLEKAIEKWDNAKRD